jgi:mRNA-degrading endonuclease toxin of MazEF toxin-antitoxin module
MRLSVICEVWDVAVVPIPFSDSPNSKRRPAVVLSAAAFNRAAGHTIMAMITTAQQSSWPGDIPLVPSATGLQKECLVRMKLFTLDNRLIVRTIATLPVKERHKVRGSLRQSLGV